MAQVRISFGELLELARSTGSLPAALRDVSCEDDALYLTAVAEPLALEARTRLRFEGFADGVATFSLHAQAASSLEKEPERTFMAAVGAPEPGAFELDVPRLKVDLNRLVGAFAGGVVVQDFRLSEGEFTLSARVENFSLRRSL